MQEMIKDAIKWPEETFISQYLYGKPIALKLTEKELDNYRKELSEFYKEANELNEWADHIIKMEDN